MTKYFSNGIAREKNFQNMLYDDDIMVVLVGIWRYFKDIKRIWANTQIIISLIDVEIFITSRRVRLRALRYSFVRPQM
jgi:hypothetical protein